MSRKQYPSRKLLGFSRFLVFFALSLVALVALSLGITGCAIIPGADTDQDPHQTGSKVGAVIVAVEGLSFVNTFMGELANLSGIEPDPMEERDTYLSESLSRLLSDDRFEISSFRWSGNATGDTAMILEDSGDNSLRQFLRDKRDYATSLGLPLIVVGHSWGTVLTYLALSLEAAKPDPLEVDLYITLSTPIGTNFAQPGTYPEEAVITDYLEDWFDTLGFETTNTVRPRASSFVNFWAWGDFISGPLTNFVPDAAKVTDIRVDEGLFDLPLDSSYSRTAAYSNRNLLDAKYWHKFTTADPVVLSDEFGDYLSQDFIRDADVAFHAFQQDLGDYIRGASRMVQDRSSDLGVSISGITVVEEFEGDGLFNPADDSAEYFGYFFVSLDGEKQRIKRLRSENDYISLEKDDYHAIDWQTRLFINGTEGQLSIGAELYEDELGDDIDYPGIASTSLDLSNLDSTTLPQQGSFDVSWQDSSDGLNTVRVHFTIDRIDGLN
jgi:pimeloyl-ACP methyl ester carboxylesterase